MYGFEQAFQRLMSRAPGPVFPRARRLYFNKYPLEPDAATGSFRTFLLEETIEEGPDGTLRIRAHAFALVPWDPVQARASHQAPLQADQGARYMKDAWNREPTGITMIDGPWFRSDCAYLRVTIQAHYCNRSVSTAAEQAPDGHAP